MGKIHIISPRSEILWIMEHARRVQRRKTLPRDLAEKGPTKRQYISTLVLPVFAFGQLSSTAGPRVHSILAFCAGLRARRGFYIGSLRTGPHSKRADISATRTAGSLILLRPLFFYLFFSFRERVSENFSREIMRSAPLESRAPESFFPSLEYCRL